MKVKTSHTRLSSSTQTSRYKPTRHAIQGPPIKQIYGSDLPAPSAVRTAVRTRQDVALYRVTSPSSDRSPFEIAVETSEGVANLPRNAAWTPDMSALDLQPELDRIALFAEAVLEKLKSANPGSVEIEFGVELGGKMGIPLVTQGEAKANLKVTLKWSTTKTNAT
jgi:Trypsin-co-occurring domain 1